MPQIILKEKTAHLASYTFFTRDVDQYKTCHFHSSINHQEHLFHRILITITIIIIIIIYIYIYIYKKKPYLTLVLQKYNMVKIHSLS